MAKRRKRRRLRKRVYVLILGLLCIIVAAVIFFLPKNNKDYHYFTGDVTSVDMNLKADGVNYTYQQQYFNEDTTTYISLNDLYNLYIHVDQGQMTLNQNENTLNFTNDEVNVTLNYKDESLVFNDCSFSVQTLNYLNQYQATEKLSLEQTNTHSYIYDGEVYLSKEIVESVLLNSEYTLNLDSQSLVAN